MATKAPVLTKDNGRPVRTKDGTRVTYDMFEKDVPLEPGVSDMSDEQFIKEMNRLGLPLPKKIRP